MRAATRVGGVCPEISVLAFSTRLRFGNQKWETRELTNANLPTARFPFFRSP